MKTLIVFLRKSKESLWNKFLRLIRIKTKSRNRNKNSRSQPIRQSKLQRNANLTFGHIN